MDASVLEAKLLAAREQSVKVGHMTFRFRRPTEIQLSIMADRQKSMALTAELVAASLIGWTGVLERDIVRGESDQPAEFSPALARTWIEDRADIFDALANAIYKAVSDYREKQAAAGKN